MITKKLILLEDITINTKFNLDSVDVKIPAGEDNPEINVSIKDLSYEVTNMSLFEYEYVLKSITRETKRFSKVSTRKCKQRI